MQYSIWPAIADGHGPIAFVVARHYYKMSGNSAMPITSVTHHRCTKGYRSATITGFAIIVTAEY